MTITTSHQRLTTYTRAAPRNRHDKPKQQCEWKELQAWTPSSFQSPQVHDWPMAMQLIKDYILWAAFDIAHLGDKVSFRPGYAGLCCSFAIQLIIMASVEQLGWRQSWV